MSLLFSDRFRLLKLGAAAFLFVALCSWANVRIGREHPPVSGVRFYGDQWRDKTLASHGQAVLAHAPDGFDMETQSGPVRILTSERPPVGAYVSIVGRIAGAGRIEASRVQRNEGWEWKRPLNYGVSVVTALLFLWFIHSRFRIRLSEGLFRSRF